ncbi:MAG TPA: hypothetical protein VGA44_09575 [Steroidobacteraceae bacterium]
MNTWMNPLAGLALLGALGAGSAIAQSSAEPANAVTTAVTVSAQREPTITVLAPREAASGLPTGKRQHAPVTITKAVDVDGDGMADAPKAAPRDVATGQSSGKRQHAPATTQDAADQDCDGKAEKPVTAPRGVATGVAAGQTNVKRSNSSSEVAAAHGQMGCTQHNPMHKPKAVGGENPLYKDKSAN